MVKRIEVIAQNGGDGAHYLVEKIARVLAGDDADQVLGGKNTGKKRWELHINMAIKLMDELELWPH